MLPDAIECVGLLFPATFDHAGSLLSRSRTCDLAAQATHLLTKLQTLKQILPALPLAQHIRRVRPLRGDPDPKATSPAHQPGRDATLRSQACVQCALPHRLAPQPPRLDTKSSESVQKMRVAPGILFSYVSTTIKIFRAIYCCIPFTEAGETLQ